MPWQNWLSSWQGATVDVVVVVVLAVVVIVEVVVVVVDDAVVVVVVVVDDVVVVGFVSPQWEVSTLYSQSQMLFTGFQTVPGPHS